MHALLPCLPSLAPQAMDELRKKKSFTEGSVSLDSLLRK